MTHIFYCPHADDETLTMGVGILQCLERGEQVYLVLMTDGSACGSIHFLNGTAKCPIHNKFHDPIEEHYLDGMLDTQDHIAARRREFLSAASLLGVPSANCRVYGYKDGKLTEEQARQIAMRIEKDEDIPSPKTHHTTTSKYDDHNDHISCGNALAALHQEGIISTVPVYYVKRSKWKTIPDGGPVEKIAAEGKQKEILRKVCEDVYMNWDPEKGHYAVGYHSVPQSFDHLLKDFTNRVHK